MTVHLPRLGVTSCHRSYSLLEEYPSNIVGSFWIMCGYGFDYNSVPDWWVDNVLEQNQAQGLIKAWEKGYFQENHNNPLYLGFCIIVVSDSSNPANLAYVIQHLRMFEGEGIRILRYMADHNIPAHTEVTYPEYFLSYRYGTDNYNYKYLRETLAHWSVQVWEDYCSMIVTLKKIMKIAIV